jgi:putative flippase GtrA
MIALKYTFFAIISTAFNLFFQFLALLIYSGQFDLYLAMFVGTGAGLVSKYILDKKFIFYHKPETKAEDAKKFAVYTFTGIFTTIIFWGTEIAFDLIFDFDWAKYLGAIIGLSIGYVVKYFLDKKYVFKGAV